MFGRKGRPLGGLEGKGAISWDFDSARCLGEPLLVDSFLKTIRYGEAQKKVHSLGWAKTVSFQISLVLYNTGGPDANRIAFTWFSFDLFDPVAIFGILFRVGYAAKLKKDYGWQQSELGRES